MSKRRGTQHLKRRTVRTLAPRDDYPNRMTRQIDEHADSSRTIHLTDEGVQMFNDLRASFVEKFGREPLPHEPLFFDPDADTPQPMSVEKLRRMLLDMFTRSGMSPTRALQMYGAMERGEHHNSLLRPA